MIPLRIARLQTGARSSAVVAIVVMLMLPPLALAGPGEDANMVIDRWSAAYSANDPEAEVKNYRQMRFCLAP